MIGQSNIANPYMFHGRRQDPETGLYYNRLRYYCSRTGRFTRIDPGGNWADPATIGNGYNFGDAAPTFGVDPDGQFFFAVLAIIVVAVKSYDAVDTAVEVAKEVVAVASGEKSVADAAASAAKSVVIGATVGVVGKTVYKAVKKVGRAARGTPAVGEPPRLLHEPPSPSKAPTPAPRGPATGSQSAPRTPPPPGKSPASSPSSSRSRAGTGDGKSSGGKADGDSSSGGIGGGCFLLGTMVATPDGMRPIESLEVGDSVLSRNDKTGEVGFKKIEHVHRYHTNRVCRLLTTRAHRTPTRQRGRSEPHRVGKGSASADDDSSESGSSGDAEDSESATELPIQELLCTTGHNFYSVTRSDWIAAVYLRPGEVLLDASGRIQRVVSVTCEDAHAPVRDFEVADWHTYFVSQPGAATSVWTHNGGKDKPCNSNPDSSDAASGPREPYNRRDHYGRTPTKSDRKAVGAEPDEVADHDPPLVKRYYEGDPTRGEKPGYRMSDAERRASAKDRTRLRRQPRVDSDRQGGEMSGYAKRKRKEHGF